MIKVWSMLTVRMLDYFENYVSSVKRIVRLKLLKVNLNHPCMPFWVRGSATSNLIIRFFVKKELRFIFFVAFPEIKKHMKILLLWWKFVKTSLHVVLRLIALNISGAILELASRICCLLKKK